MAAALTACERVEDRIRCACETGLRNLSFQAFPPNEVWLELVLCAQDLLAWMQGLLLTGERRVADVCRCSAA